MRCLAVRICDGVLFVNPGSAGPRRFRLPVSVALLEISGLVVSARIVELALSASAAKPSLDTL